MYVIMRQRHRNCYITQCRFQPRVCEADQIVAVTLSRPRLERVGPLADRGEALRNCICFAILLCLQASNCLIPWPLLQPGLGEGELMRHAWAKMLDSMEVVDITITARAEAVNKPWLWQLGRDFKVKYNIVKANIDSDYGWVQIKLEGPVEEVQRATAWLMTTGMHVEAAQRAVGA